MKVLAISYGKNFFESGNTERERMRACAHEAGELHTIVFTGAHEGLATETIDPGFVVYPTNSKNKLRKVIDAIRIGTNIISEQDNINDWVITAQDPFEAGLVAWRISKATGAPFNIQEPGDFFSNAYWTQESILNRFRAVFGKFLMKKSHSVRVVSRRIQRTLVRLGVCTDKIHILSVHTDTLRFTTAAPDPDSIPNYDARKKYVLTVARFVPQKNLSLLIRAFAKVHTSFPRAHLLLVGQGTEEHTLKTLAQKLLPQDSYTFMGWSEDVPTLMATADVYALSSNYEGWARVLIEATAVGMPIVTTDVGCAGEAITESRATKIIPIGDEAALVTALETILLDLDSAGATVTDTRNVTLFHPITHMEYAKDWVTILERTRTPEL